MTLLSFRPTALPPATVPFAVALSLVCAVGACAPNPADNVAPAQVGQAVEEGSAAEAAPESPSEAPSEAPVVTAPPTETVAVTPDNAQIGFEGSKVTGSHVGNFPSFTGELTLNPADLTASRVALTIDMTTLTADNERLTGHLRSDDFFNVALHPTATFTSTAIAAGGASGATHTVTGNLTLVGQTRSISFPATIAVADEAVTAQAEFFILREDFGIVYPGAPNDLIRNEVVIRLNLNLPRG